MTTTAHTMGAGWRLLNRLAAVLIAFGLGTLLGDTAWHRLLIYFGALALYAVGHLHGKYE